MTDHASKLGGSKPPNPKVPATEEEIRASNLAPVAFATSSIGVLLACLGFIHPWLLLCGAVGLVGWYLGSWSLRTLKFSQHPRNRHWASGAVGMAVCGLLLVGLAVGTVHTLTRFGEDLTRKYALVNMDTIHARLNQYDEIHGDLSPGGPVLAGTDWFDNSPEKVYDKRVEGRLTVADLVNDDDLIWEVSMFTIEVTGPHSVEIVYLIDGEPYMTMTVPDVREDEYELSPRRR